MAFLYCPNCRKNVSCVRKEFNWVLAIILTLFTGGLLLLIYVAIYFSKEPNLCAQCGTVCHPQMVTSQATNMNLQASAQVEIMEKHPAQDKSNFCTSCGSKLDDRPDIKFCVLCGTSVA